jgi:hypothetical protein
MARSALPAFGGMMQLANKIPFWATVGDAYASVWQHCPAALRLLIPLLTVYCAGSAALHWWQFQFQPASGMSLVDIGFSLADEGLAIALGVFMAVKWHRLLLLGEAASWAWPPPRVLVRYLTAAAVVWLAMSLPMYAVIYGVESGFSYAVPDDGHANEADGTEAEPNALHWQELVGLLVFSAALVFAMTPIIAALCYVPLRLSLALPATALGAFANRWARAWTLSRGNFGACIGAACCPMYPPSSAPLW